jgi:hypothetical protein
MTRKVLMQICSILILLSFYSSIGVGQATSKQMAAIPFTFVFEGLTLPPGTYEVDMMDSGMLMLLDSKQRPVQGEAATLPLPLESDEKAPELIFVNAPEGYRLVEVRTPTGRRLLTSEYGHGKFIGQQLRGVPITTVAEQSTAEVQPASTRDR